MANYSKCIDSSSTFSWNPYGRHG